ncbi:hypothetical protein ABZX92_03315 [Lentzea sp. NPDC006480]|uniref:hypothetical protein n=1 Tax=Lentzea sp. NPDC006480 TaxID=3157176 RepID=UPI0033B1B601
MRVLSVWRMGGPATREAAANALVGTDADIKAFLDNGWNRAAESDERSRVVEMLEKSGVSVKQAAQKALDAANPSSVKEFLETGWVAPNTQDLRIRINQMMAIGGANLRAAGQAALDTATQDAYRAFLNEGWQTPDTTDQRLRVNQLMAAGGQKVKQKAQEALDAGTAEAFQRFFDYDWPTAQARDQETASIIELTNVAKVAGELAAKETQAAKDASEQAVTEALLAKEAAEKARAATESARDNAQLAGAAAGVAADAANRAARAASEAISAANIASNAARIAASAASRAATAAAMAGQAASRAYDAAAATATDAANVPVARDAAVAARAAAEQAQSTAQAAEQAQIAADNAMTAANAAVRAGDGANAAARAANEAGDFANQAGADAAVARNAAATASNQAARATKAAKAASDYAKVAAAAAGVARTAATRAAADAIKAAEAAEAAITHAGNAAMAAAESTKHANAASEAAKTALEAAAQARTIYDAARANEAAKLDVRASQATEAAQQAKAAVTDVQAAQKWDAEQAALRDAETNRWITEATAAGAPDAVVTTNGRKIAMRLSDGKGSWTKAAATSALVSSDDEVREYVRTGIAFAAARDDRVTLQSKAKGGSQALRDAANAALAGSDADVQNFLRNPVYTGRDTEDRIKVNQLMADAQAANRQTTIRSAQKALDTGTAAAYRTFLDKDRFTAGVVDDRVDVNRIIADQASGPETKAMAQAVLAGPPTAIRQWLDSGRFVSAKADQETAAHVAEIQGYLAMAAGAAATAAKNANEAQATAAVARNAANEAAGYADQAKRDAADASRYAQEAKDSATAAERSAQAAAESARVANNAAKSAQSSAQQAMRSATWAQASANEAAGFATQAYASAREAYDTAMAAHAGAEEARAAAKAAVDNVTNRINDAVTQKANQQITNCRSRHGAGTPEYENCVNLLSQNEYDTVSRMLMNGEKCMLLYREKTDSAGFQNCVGDAMSPDFEANRKAEFALEQIALLTMILGGAALAGGTVLVVGGLWAAGVLGFVANVVMLGMDAVMPLGAIAYPGMVMTTGLGVGAVGATKVVGVVEDLTSEGWAWRNAVSHASDEAAKIAEQERKAYLGLDTATAKFSEDEYKIAVLLEQRYNVQLLRFPKAKGDNSPNPDWIDANGVTYDAVGPIPTQFFDKQWQSQNIQGQVVKHLKKSDMVPFDVRGLTPDQVKLVEDYLKTYDTLRVFIIRTS